MTSLLFGSCLGVMSASSMEYNDYCSASSSSNTQPDAAAVVDGWYLCPSTVSYNLLSSTLHAGHPDENDDDDHAMTPQQQQQQKATDATSPVLLIAAGAHHRISRTPTNRHGRHNRCPTTATATGGGVLLLQGSTLSKHTGSSPGGQTEPSTDDDDAGHDAGDSGEEDEDDEDEGRGVQALVNFCIGECEDDCAAAELQLVNDNDPYNNNNNNNNNHLQALSSWQKETSDIVVAEQAQGQQQPRRVSNTTTESAVLPALVQEQQQQQQGVKSSPRRRFWNKRNPLWNAPPQQQQQQRLDEQHLPQGDMNFVAPCEATPNKDDSVHDTNDDDDDLISRMVCIYRPQRSWPTDEGEVRIRWALSRNTSPTTATVLERWTAAVELSSSSAVSPGPGASSPPANSTAAAGACTTDDKEEFPTRLLNFSETNDYTTARLAGTVEIHDETTTRFVSSSSSSSRPRNDTNEPDESNDHGAVGIDTSREIAWLTCYRVVFDEHQQQQQHEDDITTGLSSLSSSPAPTLIPDPNGTIGYSEKKLTTRRLFVQFDDARHGPLRNVAMQRRNETKAGAARHQQDEPRNTARNDNDRRPPPCLPTTSHHHGIPPSRSSVACRDEIPRLDKQSSLLHLEQQQQPPPPPHGGILSSSSSSSSSLSTTTSRHYRSNYFVIQDYSVHEDYRGLGLGLCLLDDACRRICDPKAWVLVALPQTTTTAAPPPQCPPLATESSSFMHRIQLHRKQRFSRGRASWSATTPLLSLSPRAMDKKSSSPDETKQPSSSSLASSSSVTPPDQTQRPDSPDSNTLLSYLGLLGFERLDDSPFCVRWNQSDHLPTIEEICPHVPIFHAPSPPPVPPTLQQPNHHDVGASCSIGICNAGGGGETQHPLSPSSCT